MSIPTAIKTKVRVLIVDNDASGTGQAAAEECRVRWLNAGKRVRRVMPPDVGEDLNDVLRKRGAAR